MAGAFIPLTACKPAGEVKTLRTNVPGVARSR